MLKFETDLNGNKWLHSKRDDADKEICVVNINAIHSIRRKGESQIKIGINCGRSFTLDTDYNDFLKEFFRSAE